MQVFGCMSYVHVKKDKRSGFSPHMQKAIFVGYPPNHKGWEFFDPVKKTFILSDRADFDERVFPGLKTRLPEPPAFTSPPASSSTPLVTDDASDDDDGTAMHRRVHQQVGDLVGDANAPSIQPAPQQQTSPP